MSSYEEYKEIGMPTVLASQDINCLSDTSFRVTQSDNLFPCFIAKKSLQVTKYFLSIELNQKVRILLSSTNTDSEKMTISLAKTHARQLPKVIKTTDSNA